MECPLCLESYNTTDQKCMIICSEGHSMCRNCRENMVGKKCPSCRNQLLPGVNLEMIEMMKDETIIKKENVVDETDENKTINQEEEQLISESSLSGLSSVVEGEGTRATGGGKGGKGSATRPFAHLSNLSAIQVADMIRDLGCVYSDYANGMIENGLSGAVLEDLDEETLRSELPNTIPITKLLHITAMIKRFKDPTLALPAPTVSTQPPSPFIYSQHLYLISLLFSPLSTSIHPYIHIFPFCL